MKGPLKKLPISIIFLKTTQFLNQGWSFLNLGLRLCDLKWQFHQLCCYNTLRGSSVIQNQLFVPLCSLTMTTAFQQSFWTPAFTPWDRHLLEVFLYFPKFLWVYILLSSENVSVDDQLHNLSYVTKLWLLSLPCGILDLEEVLKFTWPDFSPTAVFFFFNTLCRKKKKKCLGSSWICAGEGVRVSQVRSFFKCLQFLERSSLWSTFLRVIISAIFAFWRPSKCNSASTWWLFKYIKIDMSSSSCLLNI